MKKIIPVFVLFFTLIQCDNSTQSLSDPEIIFSKPYYTITSSASGEIVYDIDLEFMVTAKNCHYTSSEIIFQNIGIIENINTSNDLEVFENYKIFNPITVDEENYIAAPKVVLTLYDAKNDEELIGECILNVKE